MDTRRHRRDARFDRRCARPWRGDRPRARQSGRATVRDTFRGYCLPAIVLPLMQNDDCVP